MGWTLGLLVAACSLRPELVPDARAVRALDESPLGESIAVGVADVAGMHVTVDGAAWTGAPVNLSWRVTPVRVTLENKSGRMLSISSAQLTLVGATGVRYRALPPLPADASVEVVAPRFQAHGFYVAASLGPAYPSYAAWPDFPFDADYQERNYAYWPAGLPTQDMLGQALPDGVIADGGSVSGFVYFPALSPDERRVQFDVQLVDTEQARPLAEAWVPMAVRRPL